MQAVDIAAAYADALIHGDMPAMQSLWADEFVLDWVHADAFEDTLSSPEQITQFWPAWLAGFTAPDYEVTRTVAAETVVVMQWVFRGTHTQPIGPPVFAEPIQPRRRTIRLRGVTFLDIAGGKIQKETIYLDLVTLYVELGVDLHP